MMSRRLIPLALAGFAFFATPGCGSSSEDDDTTVVPGESPLALIDSVSEGDQLYPGDAPWRFTGTVADGDTASPQLLIARFTLSDPDGIVATVDPVPDASGVVVLEVSYLKETDYTLRLDVEDPDGLSSSAQVSFGILNREPAVQILGPVSGDEVYQGQPFTINAHITDEDNPTGTAFKASLVDSADHLLSSGLTDANGDVSFQYVPQSTGEIELSVVAEDELGKQGASPFIVIVKPCTDGDGDGVSSCPVGSTPADCDDEDADISPTASERCDGRDTDCDGLVPLDELDGDGDALSPCKGDCNDSDPLTYTGAREVCDGLDNDCDEELPPEEVDQDGDGYRACASSTTPADCDDELWNVNPAALEICDGLDDNCDDALADEELDEDEDGWFPCSGDCNDNSYYSYPGAVERLDLQDNDCDGNVEGPLRLDAAQARYDGVQQDSLTGWSLSAGGDLNGDAVGDLAIGAPKYNGSGTTGGNRGGAFVVLGRSSGWSSQVGVSLSKAVIINDVEPAALTGTAVSIATDMTGDRIDDLVIGSPGHTAGNFTQAGAAYLVAGRKTWTNDTVANLLTTVVEGTSSGMNLGTSLSPSADVNGDTTIDVAVGGPWSTRRPSATGIIAILSRPLLGWPTRTNLNTLGRILGVDDAAIGTALAVGSSTGDAFADLLIAGLGNPTTLTGQVYWVPGSTSIRAGAQTSTSSLNAKNYDGETNSERIGNSISGGVDVDGDKLDDILIGRLSDGAPGDAAAYLLFGTAAFPTSGKLEGIADVRFMRTGSDECPCSVTGIGDWNGDGLGDFAIGVARSNDGGTDAGKVYLFIGRSGRSAWPETVSLDEADGILIGEAANDQAGISLAGGDVNADGVDDLIIGAPYASVIDATTGTAISRAGAVYVVLGPEP